ncbi:MAG TPA: RNA methyltransferase [Segeticoccus sp.]|uniref:TrmH family RNA methyltransferase n=1 Tax=Segeticoccus sp. TaxID=2706531 RepID=UPI002D80E25B|nr:RNA methyltransferase [Segeticoccus sp.]HET8600703.1 RNA methyltransferase [Segeticoccus sp.]
MLTNPRSDRVKAVRALGRRAVRVRQRRFLAEGPQAVREAVRHRPDLVEDLYHVAEAADRHPEVLALAHRAGLSVHPVSAEVMAAMADAQTPQGLVAVCRPVDVQVTVALTGSPRCVVVLAHVRDPGNAGTVIRAADAAGADAVLLSSDSVDVQSPKVVRSTAGSLFHLPIAVGVPLAQLLDAVSGAGLRLLAADGGGQRSLAEADLSAPHAWVMGNEAWGLSEEVRARCDDVVSVPILGQAESLNLAMAATVCLYASAGVLHSGRAAGTAPAPVDTPGGGDDVGGPR